MSEAVLIKMDMPKSCDVCTFMSENCEELWQAMTCMNYVADCYLCDVTEFTTSRHPECPLIKTELRD